MSRGSSFPMVPVPEALEAVLQQAQVAQVGEEEVPLARALGRVLARDVAAQQPLPPFPASIKDGYALHVTEEGLAGTEGKEFAVQGRVLAGADVSQWHEPLAEDGIYPIMTGAPVPPNCNAVVMVEWTELLERKADGSEGRVRLLRAVPKVGHDIRPVGSDLAPGTTVLEKGVRLGAAEVGLLASVGAQRVAVRRPVRVAVMSTGDELLDTAADQQSAISTQGKIWDSNRPMLLALVEEFGGGMWEAVDLGIAKDDPAGTEEALRRAMADADLVISSGGVSMGDVDLVKGYTPLAPHRH
jgi:gephyrin